MTSDLKYSPDDLDTGLYEAGDAPVNISKKSKEPKKKNLKQQPNAMSGQELCDYLVLMASRNDKSLSAMELGDLRPPTSGLVSFNSPNSSNLLGCIKTTFPDWKSVLNKKKACLSVLIITSSAIRATELIKQLSSIRVHSGIGKCFAKHFKIEEQLEFFSSNRPAIAVGTPNRLQKLFSSSHAYFNFESVKLCIIDTQRDAKERNIFEIPETCTDLLMFYRTSILPALKDNRVKLVFF